MLVRLTKLQKIVGLLIAIIIMAFFWLTREILPSPLTDKEKVVMETLFEKVKPQCIGRYVMDVPESFNNKLRNKIFIGDFKIESQFIYPPAFKQRIELREKALRDRTTSEENAPVLKEIIQLPNGKGVIFDRNNSGQDDSSRTLEAHVYTEHIAFIITVDILDLSNPKHIYRKESYKKAGFSEVDMNEKPAKLAAMQSLISRLSGRLDHEIPIEKGVCIPNGFIVDDDSKPTERLYFLYENDDFSLSVNMEDHVTAVDDTLLNRSSEIKKSMVLNNMHTFKKGEIKPNGVPVQEWLMAGQQDVYNEKENKVESGFPYYYFLLKANQGTSSFDKPFLSLTLFNDNKKTTYSDAEMVEIWDRIVGSLRYKPNAF
ncbi:T6SS immunity protein Tli4 family protein [Providencia rettgeri]|uniref:T6SS immunity protein Tli4 family protein n=1 Tax=Providencia rettgeri TaxID=587 RepID=UPI0034E09A92